jgi:DNA-binding XRE family transcriptional regulator
MGNVIHLDRGHRHASASASLKPKTVGSTFFPSRASARENVRKFSAGIKRRVFQFETADMPTPAKSAVAALPPRASTTASTDLSMRPVYSQTVTNVNSHVLAVDDHDAVGLKSGVLDTSKALGRRLIATRLALGLSAADLCRRIDCKPNRWSQYETGERRITLEIADRLCAEFRLSLDWIYRGDPSALSNALRMEIRNKLAA